MTTLTAIHLDDAATRFPSNFRLVYFECQTKHLKHASAFRLLLKWISSIRSSHRASDWHNCIWLSQFSSALSIHALSQINRFTFNDELKVQKCCFCVVRVCDGIKRAAFTKRKTCHAISSGPLFIARDSSTHLNPNAARTHLSIQFTCFRCYSIRREHEGGLRFDIKCSKALTVTI